MYGQSDPSGVREDTISRASTIEDTLAWSGLIHIKPCCKFQLKKCHQLALRDRPYHDEVFVHLPKP